MTNSRKRFTTRLAIFSILLAIGIVITRSLPGYMADKAVDAAVDKAKQELNEVKPSEDLDAKIDSGVVGMTLWTKKKVALIQDTWDEADTTSVQK